MLSLMSPDGLAISCVESVVVAVLEQVGRKGMPEGVWVPQGTPGAGQVPRVFGYGSPGTGPKAAGGMRCFVAAS